jgi:sporulation protein YlmC with PRC-barrel domain
MAHSRDFDRKLIISSSDGRLLGEIKGILLDASASRGVAVFLGKTGILSRKATMIDLKHFQVCGIDAWLTKDSDCVVSSDEYPGYEKLVLAGDLFGREIQTEGGHRIGTIGDVLLDDKFNVLGFAFDKLHMEGPLAKARAIARIAVTSLGDNKNPAIASIDQAEKITLSS